MTEYGGQIVFALILGIPVACITWTVTQEDIFQEMRIYLAGYHAHHRHAWWRRKLAYMPTCPYCLSHYVAGVLIVLLHFKMLSDDWRGYLVSLFTLVLIANVYITVYHLLRVGLRWTRSMADRAETPALAGPNRAISGMAAVAPPDLAAIRSRRQGARSVAVDRRA